MCDPDSLQHYKYLYQDLIHERQMYLDTAMYLYDKFKWLLGISIVFGVKILGLSGYIGRNKLKKIILILIGNGHDKKNN